MGYVRVRGTIANPFRRDLKVDIEFIADTAAIYTVIPKYIAEKLGLEVIGRRRFKIAGGEVAEYPISKRI